MVMVVALMTDNVRKIHQHKMQPHIRWSTPFYSCDANFRKRGLYFGSCLAIGMLGDGHGFNDCGPGGYFLIEMSWVLSYTCLIFVCLFFI